MHRPNTLVVRLVSVSVFLLILNGCGGGASGGGPSGPTPPTASLTANPTAIQKGKSSTLTWTTTNATAVSISGIGSVAASGSQQVTPTTGTTYTLTATGVSGTQPAIAQAGVAIQKIQHVVVVVQENRTPDNLFQDPNLIAKGADIQNYGYNSQGTKITLSPLTLQTTYDLSHSHSSFLAMYDGGKMDGADKIPVICDQCGPPPPPPNPQFQYVIASDVAPYFQMAETYTFGDRMFQTNQGPSFPSHQFIISGTSAPTPPGNQYSDWFAAENPQGVPSAGGNTGCTAPLQEFVELIDPSGNESTAYNNGFPCYDHPTLTDLFDSNQISWRYYVPTAGSLWTAPNAIKHICVPNSAGTTCTGSDWTHNVVLNRTQVLTDIADNQLASVSWVIPDGKHSDHAQENDGSGPSWVASVVNAVGNSPYWANTAIIIIWDDWGGWYDHVPPTILNYYEFGFRVPLIVVSPYAKPAHISHQVNDFGSILKFMEETFALPTVAPGASPPYVDELSGSVSGDLSDCFNYNQTPLTFQTISAPLDEKHFLENKSPPSPPDND